MKKDSSSLRILLDNVKIVITFHSLFFPGCLC